MIQKVTTAKQHKGRDLTCLRENDLFQLRNVPKEAIFLTANEIHNNSFLT